MEKIPTLADIEAAADRIAPYAHQTPILTCQTIDEMLGMQLFFKCENLQKVGAFKFRGATNAVFAMEDTAAAKGVATHSSGNHAQALALAAKIRGIPAHIVMPETAPAVKKAAVAGYGANITFCKPTLEARESTLAEVVAETGATFVHPYDNSYIVAGQATAAREMLATEVKGFDVLMAPVGGGGLASGTALTAHYLSPKTAVIAGEPAGADDAYRSMKENRRLPSVNPQTIADGLLTSLGELSFSIIRDYVQEIVTVSEDAIIQAMRLVWERMKIIIEPSSAVPLAVLLEHDLGLQGKRVGIIISGGNIDLGKLPW